MNLCGSIGAKYDTGSNMRRRVRIDAPGALHHILGVSGYDFGKAVNRVAQLFDMKPREILFPGKQAQPVKARSLLCYWAVKEPGISTTSVANKLGMHESRQRLLLDIERNA